MTSSIVLGTQFGDEGKGKIVDYTAKKAAATVRFQGGNNAGHTVKVGNETFKFHLLPSGIVLGKKCFLASNVVVDPTVLLRELSEIKKKIKNIDLKIDSKCNIIMPYHIQLDKLTEDSKKTRNIGTTKRGIGPCYADKVSRQGIRAEDLLDKKTLKEKLDFIFPLKKKTIEKVFNGKLGCSKQKLLKEYTAIGRKIKPMVADVSMEVNELIKKKKSIIFEGAQGTFLDNSYGFYPFVTSSSTIASEAFTSSGLTSNHQVNIVGVAKAYTTRVGLGEFKTEIEGKLADYIREEGQEFGTTTGRPRRIGWLDLVLLRTSIRLNGITEIALTKLDVLSGIKKIKICTAYRKKGKACREIPATLKEMHESRAVYRTINGFELTGKEKTFRQLPANAKKMIKLIERETERKVSMIGVGPERSRLIKRKN